MRRWCLIWMLVLATAAAACDGDDGTDAGVDTTTTTTTATTTTETTTTATTTTETTVAADPEPLTAQEVFARSAPALAFVETDLGTGSGVVFAPGLVVTNAHVVWPFERVRVVFPDGAEILEAPVVAVDQIADLAIVDVGEAGDVPAPLAFGDAQDLPIGTEMYLVGYPGEVDAFPQPTITRGILSRMRYADAFDLSFLQTDAVIAGGQSGGALVSDAGEVVGISGFGTEGFALVTSAPDVLARLDRMVAGEDVDGLEYRRVGQGAGGTEFELALDNFLSDHGFVLAAEPGTEFTVTAVSDQDAIIALIAIDGLVEIIADDTETGDETLTFVTELDAPYFVVASAFTLEPAVVELTSDVPLVPWDDPDDGTPLRPGDVVYGHVDYPGDNDYYVMDLVAGDSVTVTVESLAIAPGVIVDVADNADEPLAADEGSAGGLFGTDARLEFTAAETRGYLIGVSDVAFFGPGGYRITVE